MSAETERLVIGVGSEFVYTCDRPTPAVFLVRPMLLAPHRVTRELWESTPQLEVHDYIDLYGNSCRRLTLPAGRSVVRYDATVTAPPLLDPRDPDAMQNDAADLPDEVLVYTLPSRYCQSDLLADRAWELFGSTAPGMQRAEAVCEYVNGSITFGYGSSSPTTSAVDVIASGNGVCRDFAHVFITFCRALGIPARYVFGYLPDIDVPPVDLPMDFAAWTEVYLGDRWWTFDPRNGARRKGRVLIARGRDALDVAMVTTFGRSNLESMTVWSDRKDAA